MYDDNVTYKVGINWKDIIIKFVMLVLFVIILLLLFPKGATGNITANRASGKH